MPGFETRDGVPQRRQLDVGVERVHISPMAMSHEFLAHICDHAKLDQSRVEGMAQIVETVVRNPGTAEGSRPTGLEVFQRDPFVGEERPRRLASCQEHLIDPIGHRD